MRQITPRASSHLTYGMLCGVFFVGRALARQGLGLV